MIAIQNPIQFSRYNTFLEWLHMHCLAAAIQSFVNDYFGRLQVETAIRVYFAATSRRQCHPERQL